MHITDHGPGDDSVHFLLLRYRAGQIVFKTKWKVQLKKISFFSFKIKKYDFPESLGGRCYGVFLNLIIDQIFKMIEY